MISRYAASASWSWPCQCSSVARRHAGLSSYGGRVIAGCCGGARRGAGCAFVYAAVVTRDELDRGIKEDVVDGLLGHGADGVEPVLACIVDTISERDRELLDELDRLVQEKKRELRNS